SSPVLPRCNQILALFSTDSHPFACAPQALGRWRGLCFGLEHNVSPDLQIGGPAPPTAENIRKAMAGSS
ncbi:MAG: hypothetical protein ACREE1_17400, partial [Stellaceae bacterium]